MALTNLSQITTSGISTLADINLNNITGVAATFTGNVTVGGTLTYDDVTNIDSVGLVTARSGVSITGGDLTLPDAIIHAGDTNTKIRFPAADTVTIETGGTEAFKVRTDQRVQITSGSAEIIGAEGASAQLRLTADEGDEGADYWRFESNHSTNKLNIATYITSAWVDKVTMTTGGNVGIGTDNPVYKLQVENSGTALGRFLRTNAGAGLFQIMSQDGGSITLGLGDVSDPDIQYIKSDNSDNSLSFGTAADERLRITSDGKIGINNSTPLYAMHFKNAMGSSPSFIHMEVTGSNTVGGGGGIAFDTSASNALSNNGLYLATISGVRNSADDGSNDLVFKTSKAGVAGDDGNTHSPKERLRITSDGNIGIGLTNPDQLFHIESSAATRAKVSTTSASHFGVMYFGDEEKYIIGYRESHSSTPRHLSLKSTHSSGVISFFTGSGGERLRITSNGGVLIGGHTTAVDSGNAPNIEIVNTSTSTLTLARNDTSISSGHDIAAIRVWGNDSNGTYQQCAEILAEADGDHGTDDKPTALSFKVTADGASSPTERLRIDSAGNTTLGYAGSSLHFQNGFNNSTARIQNGGGSNSSELKFLVRNAGTESEKMRLTSTAGLAIVTAGSMPANAGNETLYVMGEGHTGHGTSNTRSVVSIIGALTSNSSAAGIWMGARTNDNTAVIGTRTSSGNLAFETYSGGWGERMRIKSNGQVLVGNYATHSAIHGNLEVNGNDGINISNATRTGTNGAQWRLIPNSGGSNTGAASNLRLYEGAGGVEVLNIQKAGQVMIGHNELISHPNMDDLQIGDANGNRGITICSGTSAYGSVCFGDSTDGSGNDRYSGFVEYYHHDNSMRLGTSSGERLRIVKTTASISSTGTGANGTGCVGINEADPATDALSLAVLAPYGLEDPRPNVYFKRSFGIGGGSSTDETNLYCDGTGGSYNSAGVVYSIKSYAKHNLSGSHYAGHFVNHGSAYSANGTSAVYAETHKTDTNGPGELVALHAKGRMTYTVNNSGYATAGLFQTTNNINGRPIVCLQEYTANTYTHQIEFRKHNGSNIVSVGSIKSNNTATQYNTSSDYRLKENVVSLTGAIDRLKQLQPKRFNFIGEEETIDGFIAHEVSSTAPYAVSGEKDAMKTELVVDEDGKEQFDENGEIISKEVIDPQGVDYGKLSALTIAALQEALAKIETLEAKVAALEGS